MKINFLTLICVFLLPFFSIGQTNICSFSTVKDTIIEANSSKIVTYIKISPPFTTLDSIQVYNMGGNLNASRINYFSDTILKVPAGLDSIPFILQIIDDSIYNNLQTDSFLLGIFGSSSLGANYIFHLSIIDNDLPVTFSFVKLKDSIFEHADSFSICLHISNPNSYPMSYYLYTDLINSTAVGGWDYGFNWDTHFAPPGNSTFCQTGQVFDNLVINPTKYIVFELKNIGDSYWSDSMYLYILDDDTWIDPSISIQQTNYTVWEDTAGMMKIPVTVINPNYYPVTGSLAVWTPFCTATDGQDFILNLYRFSHGQGTFYDTIFLYIVNDQQVENTEIAKFHFINVRSNTSPDSVLTVTILDRDSVKISFLGAANVHLENEDTAYVKVINTSSVNYPIQVDVKYYNGNATPGVDFIFKDTTLTFASNTVDTFSLPIKILNDIYFENPEQVNLRLENPMPANTKFDIQQYTCTILDDDTLVNSVLDNGAIYPLLLYPNPAQNLVYIKTTLPIQKIQIVDIWGNLIAQKNNLEVAEVHEIDSQNWSAGIYFATIYFKEGEKKIKFSKK